MPVSQTANSTIFSYVEINHMDLFQQVSDVSLSLGSKLSSLSLHMKSSSEISSSEPTSSLIEQKPSPPVHQIQRHSR